MVLDWAIGFYIYSAESECIANVHRHLLTNCKCCWFRLQSIDGLYNHCDG
jgi:hypothetical protein